MTSTAADRRALGLFSLLALGINGIVGVGIFFVPSDVGRLVPGMAGILVYLGTALLLAPVAIAYATLGSRFDEDGGPYVWACAAFGPSAGFFVGWIAYVSAVLSTSAVVSGLATHAGPDLGASGPVAQRLFAVAAVVILAATAASGLRPSAVVWSSVTVLKLIPLLVLALVFVVVGLGRPLAALPHAAPSSTDLGRAALIVVFAMQGFEIVPVPAGHARTMGRAVPIATIGSLLFAALLYMVLHAACVATEPDLATSGAPLVAAARVLGGAGLGRLVLVGTNVSALGIAFGMFAMTPRYLAALGRDDALGAWVGKEDRRGVPLRALWLTAAAVLVLVVYGRLLELFALSSVAVLTQYAVSAAALGVLAARGKKGLRLRQLWPAPLALCAIALIGRAATRSELGVALLVLAIGGALYALRRRFRK